MYRIHIVRPYHKPDFYIETSIKELYDVLVLIYSAFISESEPEPNCYRMSFFDSPPTYNELQIIENAMYQSTKIDAEYIAIHSAVIELNDKAFLFTGRTEAGKSTLTSYLCKSGFNYFSDDIAIINRKDLSVHPFPRPVQLRAGGAEVLKKCGIDLSSCPVFSYGELSRTMLSLECNDIQNVKIGGILFIERTSNINSVTQLSKTEAFAEVMHNLFVFLPSSTELLILINRICSAPVYSIKYKDMDFVREWMLNNA